VFCNVAQPVSAITAAIHRTWLDDTLGIMAVPPGEA
jgi:hypothetical protein